MTNFSVIPTAKTLAIGISLIALVLVACTSSDEPDPTATSQSQAPVATQAPAPTATPEPPTGGETPLAPTETPVAVEEPTKAPDPRVAPVATVAPTATPDPFVVLKSIIAEEALPNRYSEVAPGDSELLERLFPDAPPYASHKISDIKITTSNNQCVTCHAYALNSGDSVATKIPISHYTDQLTGDVSEELDPRRYLCTSCHVPQVTDPLPWAE